MSPGRIRWADARLWYGFVRRDWWSAPCLFVASARCCLDMVIVLVVSADLLFDSMSEMSTVRLVGYEFQPFK